MLPRTSVNKKLFIIAWTLLRIIAVLLLWWNLVIGFAINILLDAVDGDILERLKIKRSWYQKWDKILDYWFYCALLVYALQYFSWRVILLLLFFFVLRTIGLLLFTYTKHEWLLFIFPNIFSELFIIYVIFPKAFEISWLIPAPWPLIIGLMFVCLIKEWWIHIAKIDLTNLLFSRSRKRWL
jgi:hypothetical protein